MSKELKQELEETLLKAKTLVAKRHLKRLEESIAFDTSGWMGPWSDLLNRVQGDQQNWLPISSPSSRRNGSNFPFFQNEPQLALLRDIARIVVGTNNHAAGMVGGLMAFVVGEGYTTRVTTNDGQSPELVKQTQKFVDHWAEKNNWCEFQQEVFWGSREDGESMTRIFPDDGVAALRHVWPEQITKPPGTEDREWSYGVKTPVDDVQEPLAYWVANQQPSDGQEVPASNLIHIKVNTRSGIKRGLSDFCFATKDVLECAAKLTRNLGEGSSIREAIAFIRQHATATQAEVQGFANADASYQVTQPFTGNTTNISKYEPGTVLDTPEGLMFAGVPSNPGTPFHQAVVQLLLRSAGVRWNAPEWLISGDASTMGAYTASLVAESPFVKRVKMAQGFYGRRFKQMVVRAVQIAVAYGLLPSQALQLDYQLIPPSVEVRNRLEEANTNQIYSGMGIKSPQTITQEQGLDWETEQTNVEAALARKGSEGQVLPLPGEGKVNA